MKLIIIIFLITSLTAGIAALSKEYISLSRGGKLQIDFRKYQIVVQTQTGAYEDDIIFPISHIFDNMNDAQNTIDVLEESVGDGYLFGIMRATFKSGFRGQWSIDGRNWGDFNADMLEYPYIRYRIVNKGGDIFNWEYNSRIANELPDYALKYAESSSYSPVTTVYRTENEYGHVSAVSTERDTRAVNGNNRVVYQKNIPGWANLPELDKTARRYLTCAVNIGMGRVKSVSGYAFANIKEAAAYEYITDGNLSDWLTATNDDETVRFPLSIEDCLIDAREREDDGWYCEASDSIVEYLDGKIKETPVYSKNSKALYKPAREDKLEAAIPDDYDYMVLDKKFTVIDDSITPNDLPSMESIRKRIEVVEDDYADAEFNPETMLVMPTIREMDIPTNEVFHTARRKVNDLMESARTVTSTIVSAVEKMEDSWKVAVDTAVKVGTNGMGQVSYGLAQRALTILGDPGATDGEKEAWADKLVKYISQVTVLPEMLPEGMLDEPVKLNGRKIIDNHMDRLAIAGSDRKAIEK